MTTTTTNQPENAEQTEGLPWVYIETAAGQILAVGPYPSEHAAIHALTYAPLIDGLCEEDAVDAWADAEPVPAVAHRILIDPMNPHHTGAGYPIDEGVAYAAVGLLLLLAALAVAERQG